jgi:hypothetical protein
MDGYWLDDRRITVRFLVEIPASLFSTASRPALVLNQPPIKYVPGGYFLRVKRKGSEAGHSSPSSAEVKNEWKYTSTVPYVFVA